jgi:hypothetical protein
LFFEGSGQAPARLGCSAASQCGEVWTSEAILFPRRTLMHRYRPAVRGQFALFGRGCALGCSRGRPIITAALRGHVRRVRAAGPGAPALLADSLQFKARDPRWSRR